MTARMNLKHKMGTGIHAQSFIEGMTRNQDEFLSWYNRFSWKEGEKSFFDVIGAGKDVHCLILCTDWCPDVIWNVPVLFRVLEQSPITVEVLLMEQHLETMDLFLTDGGRAQPIAVFVDAQGNVLGKWGPRPRYIQAVMEDFRKNNPDREAPDYQENVSRVRTEIAKLYNAGTEYQQVIVQELRQLLSTLFSHV
ncbi:thioredoxin family protein [Brevibacillus migulae]|uniref:thioredoxin family protein n=1 Tax=Brevibacillus migulae TaxID=1644114 RepID=UPI00106E303B|nr:thioredoxin family protein [Brevibacillus migulae]